MIATILFFGCTSINELKSNCEKETNVTNINKCYENLAIEFHDASICESVKDNCGYPYGCPNTLRCYYNVGFLGKDITTCDNNKNEEYKYNCYDGVGIGKKDISICNKIPDNYQSSKEYCKGGITPSQ